MAHGFGGTKDSGLEGFAEAFAHIGLDVLLFDYRGFGASGGDVRQTVSIENQLEDYRRAIDFARTTDGVDPRRIIVWGVSLSGGYALTLGSEDPELAALIALTPATDARATAAASKSQYGLGHVAKNILAAVRDKVATSRGRPGVTIPITGLPGELAALALPGLHENYHAIAGPTWRNEVAAKSLLEIGSFRAVKDADKIAIPLLVQIADHDRCAPPHAAASAAEVARGHVRRYPCDHFDVYPGRKWHAHVLSHQIHFLRQQLSAAPSKTGQGIDPRRETVG